MESILLLCAVVIVICIVASRLSQRLGVPALLLFLALGMLLGCSASRLITLRRRSVSAP